MTIKLIGSWNEGYAIDKHSIFSIYKGHNEYGHPTYETVRSQIGELVYQLKYKGNKNVLNDIMDIVTPVLDQWKIAEKTDIILPIPPSKYNRTFQPVFVIAQAISDYLNIPMSTEVIRKINHIPIKDFSYNEKRNNIKGSIIKEKHFKKKVNILLIDDLYDSGITLNEVVTVLRTDPYVNEVYVLVMTKTRGG